VTEESPGPLRQLAEGIWTATDPIRIVGMKLSSTMTVLRLGHDQLLLHSPVPITPERRQAVERLGTVAHLYAPNTYHHLGIAGWAQAFPAARLHGPAALSRKRPDLRIDRAHDLATEPEAAFAGHLEELHIDGFRLEETVLLYRPACTLVVADLVHNVGRPSDLWTAIYTRAMGFHDRVALSRAIRLCGLLGSGGGAQEPRHPARSLLRRPGRRPRVAACQRCPRGRGRGLCLAARPSVALTALGDGSTRGGLTRPAIICILVYIHGHASRPLPDPG
jgi:hypothetical protein